MWGSYNTAGARTVCTSGLVTITFSSEARAAPGSTRLRPPSRPPVSRSQLVLRASPDAAWLWSTELIMDPASDLAEPARADAVAPDSEGACGGGSARES